MSGDGVARSSAIMASGTLVSRVLGLVRTQQLAAVVGVTGLTADAFSVANTLPNNINLLVAGGILQSVLVPQIVKASTQGEAGEAYVDRLITLSLALMAGLTLVATVAAPGLVWVMSDTQDAQARSLAVAFAFLCLPQIFFYGLYTVLGQLLTARGRFAAFMWAPVVANVVALAGLGLFLLLGLPERARPGEWTPLMIGVLGGSATLSIAMQAFFLLIPLRRMGFSYRPTFGFRGVGLGSASRVATWTFAAVLVSQLGFIVTSKVLTWATDSVPESEFVPGRASFDTAFLLFMLPHSLVTVSLVTALYTRMARAVARDDTVELRRDLLKGLRLPAVVLVPGVAMGVVFAPVLLRAFLVRNSLAETDAVALVTTTLLLGVIPYGWLYLSDRFFYAHEDARIPFVVQLLVTSLSVTGALIGKQLGPHSAAATIGVTQSVAYAVGGLLGFTLIRRRIGRIGLWPVVSAYLRLGIPAVLLSLVAVRLVALAVPDLLREGKVVSMAVAAGAGLFVLVGTWVIAHLLRVPEVAELLGPVVRRLRRR